MEKGDMIEVLREGYRVFNEYPDKALYNDKGLCKFFFYKYGLNNQKVKELLGYKYRIEAPAFCYYEGRSHFQDEIYMNNKLSYYYERAAWCYDRMRDLINTPSPSIEERLKEVETKLGIAMSQLDTIRYSINLYRST